MDVLVVVVVLVVLAVLGLAVVVEVVLAMQCMALCKGQHSVSTTRKGATAQSSKLSERRGTNNIQYNYAMRWLQCEWMLRASGSLI